MMHSTTPKARTKLDKLGLIPSAEIPMPSGRRYVVYDKTTAIRAIEKFQKAKEAEAEKARKQAEKEQLKAQAQEAQKVKETVQAAPAEAVETASELDTVKQELQEVKSLMSQILDTITKPGIVAKKD
jgi:vacuolar-type H+-ATPase subunit E/Vma4